MKLCLVDGGRGCDRRWGWGVVVGEVVRKGEVEMVGVYVCSDE
jgi:hypothetical protein